MAKLTSFVYVLLLLTAQPLDTQALLSEIIGAASGALLVVVVPQIALNAAGFKASGIVAGSPAAMAMSLAYTTKTGVGMVSMLQSIGSAGVGAYTVIAGAISGAGVGHFAGRCSGKDKRCFGG